MKKLGKIKITLKDPDGVSNAVMDYVEDAAKDLYETTPLSEEDLECLQEEWSETVNDRLSKFFEWGEYLEVEVDLDEGTATVLPVKG